MVSGPAVLAHRRPASSCCYKKLLLARLLAAPRRVRRLLRTGRRPGRVPAPGLVLDDQALQHLLDHRLFLGRQLADRLELQAQLVGRAALVMLEDKRICAQSGAGCCKWLMRLGKTPRFTENAYRAAHSTGKLISITTTIAITIQAQDDTSNPIPLDWAAASIPTLT